MVIKKRSRTASVALTARDFYYLLLLETIEIGKGLPNRRRIDPRGGKSYYLGPLAGEEEKQVKLSFKKGHD